MVLGANGNQVQSANPNFARGPLSPFALAVIDMSADLASSIDF
jgi:hypothetical protein